MGCNISDEGDQRLSADLQNQINYVGFNSKEQEVDRFASNKPEDGFDEFFTAVQESDEQFMAVKPWIGALVAPTKKPHFNPDAPNKKLTLNFINGFKVEDSRQNMFWGKNKDEIVYCAAAIGISMNVNNLQQRFMGTGQKKEANGHVDDIMSLGVCPNRKLAVTGSLGAKPLIIVWDSDTMEPIVKTNLGRNTRAVSTIRFSKDGKYFFCSDKHNDSNVYCFRTSDAKLVGENKCGSDPVFDAQSGDNNTFACATKRGVYMFDYDGKSFNKKRGIFGANPQNAMITITYDEENKCFYSGTIKGTVYEWRGNNCIKNVKMHEGSIRGLQWSNGKLLSSGSKDNLLKVSKNLEVIQTFSIPSYAQSLDYHHGKYLVSTSCGKIITINEQTSQQTEIMQGHSTGETWGLGIGPEGNVYTTADDNQVLCFNPKTKKVQRSGIVNEKPGKKYKIGGASTLSMLPPNQHSRAVAVNSKGHVAIGTNDGELSIRSTKDLNVHLFDERVSRQWIQVIKYSPNEDRLAVGSHDNKIYILKVDGDTYTLQGKLRAHQSFITNMDWSTCGKYIQSNCGAYEYLFFNVENRQQLKSGASMLKDEEWATYTVKLGWYVQGIFPPAKSGNHVNGVDRNHGKDVIATGDDWGFVNLYRNPALKGAKCVSFRAHSSHVVRVMFDKSDEYLYSVGGYDKTLMMWKYE